MKDNAVIKKVGSNQFGARSFLDKFLFSEEGSKRTLRRGRVLIFVFIPSILISGLLPYITGKEENKGIEKTQISTPKESSDFDVKKVLVPLLNKIDATPQKKEGNRHVEKVHVPTFEAATIEMRPININAIPPGTMAEATLNSGASDGIVRATLDDSIVVDGECILKEGTTLVGEGRSQEERLFVIFTKAVSRSGKVYSIYAHALDGEDKIVGLKGSKVSNEAKKLAASIGFGFAARMAQTVKSDSRPIFDERKGPSNRVFLPGGGVIDSYEKEERNHSPSLGDALAETVGESLLERSRQKLSEIKNDKFTIEISPNRRFTILFGSKD